MVVPALSPVTSPVNEPILATAALELVQIPPEKALVNVVVPPIQIVEVPAIGGNGTITVIVLVATAVPQLLVIE